MKLRPLLILLLLLLLGQLLLLVHDARRNRKEVDRCRTTLAAMRDDLGTERRRLGRERESYRRIIAEIPTSVLMGFEDPEAVFAGFLDYLNSGALAAVDARVVMRNQLRFTSRPIPMRTSDFRFDFSFSRLAEAENFLAFLLAQQTYPVRVRQLRFSGGGNDAESDGRVKGELDLTLMIPDKLIFAGNPVATGNGREER